MPAAKCHLRLDLQSLLPRFAIVDNDAARAREVCAGIRAGEIVIFDRAYVDFAHLFGRLIRGVFWVTQPDQAFLPALAPQAVGQHAS